MIKDATENIKGRLNAEAIRVNGRYFSQLELVSTRKKVIETVLTEMSVEVGILAKAYMKEKDELS